MRTRLPLARRSSEHSAASEIWLLCLCDIHEFELAFVASDAGESAREAVGDCVDALALVLAALLRPQSLHLPPQHGTRGRSALGCRSRAISSYGSSACSRSRTRPGALKVSRFAARSSPLCPTATRRPAKPPIPSFRAAARHARPKRARVPQPRHQQLRVERTRPGVLRVCGPQLASLPDDSAPPCTAPQPFFVRRSSNGHS